MFSRCCVDYLFRLAHTAHDGFVLFTGGIRQADGCVAQKFDLAVLFFAAEIVVCQLVQAHIERREVVPCIVIAEIGRFRDKQRPCRQPHPKLTLPMWVQRQVVCLGAVALKKPCERLPGVHDLQIPRVMDQLLVLVRRRCGRGNKLVFDTLELVQKRLIGLASE